MGTVIGENSTEYDLECNHCKLKKLTNVRSKVHEEQIKLTPSTVFTIDEATSYIREDELVEVAPKYIRLCKEILDTQMRKNY